MKDTRPFLNESSIHLDDDILMQLCSRSSKTLRKIPVIEFEDTAYTLNCVFPQTQKQQEQCPFRVSHDFQIRLITIIAEKMEDLQNRVIKAIERLPLSDETNLTGELFLFRKYFLHPDTTIKNIKSMNMNGYLQLYVRSFALLFPGKDNLLILLLQKGFCQGSTQKLVFFLIYHCHSIPAAEYVLNQRKFLPPSARKRIKERLKEKNCSEALIWFDAWIHDHIDLEKENRNREKKKLRMLTISKDTLTWQRQFFDVHHSIICPLQWHTTEWEWMGIALTRYMFTVFKADASLDPEDYLKNFPHTFLAEEYERVEFYKNGKTHSVEFERDFIDKNPWLFDNELDRSLIIEKTRDKENRLVIPSSINKRKIFVICSCRSGYGFYAKTKLDAVIIEEGIEYILAGAFLRTNLTRLVLPSTIKFVGCHAFYTGLKELVILSPDCAFESAEFIYPHYDNMPHPDTPHKVYVLDQSVTHQNLKNICRVIQEYKNKKIDYPYAQHPQRAIILPVVVPMTKEGLYKKAEELQSSF